MNDMAIAVFFVTIVNVVVNWVIGDHLAADIYVAAILIMAFVMIQLKEEK